MPESMQYPDRRLDAGPVPHLLRVTQRGADLVLDRWLAAWQSSTVARPSGHRPWCVRTAHAAGDARCVGEALEPAGELGLWLVDRTAGPRLAVDTTGCDLSLWEARGLARLGVDAARVCRGGW
ncbi:hypothetical protein GCM10025868_27230 [Angustibacter aerolatus]|uniref:RES domain-containing protein n=1 Tax=Angustibacter aerolatus TaxID=1162965 RepID=A0ABQ6JGZ7_9ACTN|nr:hypothetical protein GCM10025868_27230 [Angustibacter aerolatus]